MMKTNIITMFALLLASTSLFAQGPQTEGRIRIEVNLNNVGANVLASARARFESRQRGNLTRLKFNVEGEDLSADISEVNVFLNGEFISAASVSLGRFEVDLDNNKGGIVPEVMSGDVVDVIDVNSATLLFTGTFGDGGNKDPGGGGGGEITELEIDLTNFGANPLASATAKHETGVNRVKFDVEGEDLSTSFAFVDIYAEGKYVDSAIVDMFGRFTLDLDTSEGDTNVPTLIEGDLVEVFNAENGSLMFAGMLASVD